MQRPGQKITRKTIMMHKKMKDLDRKDISSKSLLVNVMDMDDDFRWDSNVFVLHGLSIWRQGYRVEVEIQCPPDPSSNIKLFKLGRLPSKNCNWRIFYSHGCCVLFEWFAKGGNRGYWKFGYTREVLFRSPGCSHTLTQSSGACVFFKPAEFPIYFSRSPGN